LNLECNPMDLLLVRHAYELDGRVMIIDQVCCSPQEWATSQYAGSPFWSAATQDGLVYALSVQFPGEQQDGELSLGTCRN
jgi:hypothetical protein